jgi:hypothetical protein
MKKMEVKQQTRNMHIIYFINKKKKLSQRLKKVENLMYRCISSSSVCMSYNACFSRFESISVYCFIVLEVHVALLHFFNFSFSLMFGLLPKLSIKEYDTLEGKATCRLHGKSLNQRPKFWSFHRGDRPSSLGPESTRPHAT